MDILDVHIVRITELTAETVPASDQYVAIDSASYADGFPKKLTLTQLASWVIMILFSSRMYTEKGIALVADTPHAVVFPTPFTSDYIIIPSFVHSETNVGLTITAESSTGFTVTSNGDDATLDILVIPITPLT